jgi:hypothetical protein
MQLTQKPALITVPFGNSAGPSYIRTIPVPSQISIEAGAASWTDGFPPLNFTPVEGGGVPPFGQDMNGVLNNISAALRWQEAGGCAYYDSTFSTAIGGYPNKAVLVKADNTGFWANTVDNNLTNPDTGGAGWVTVTGVDYLTKSIAGGSNVTLTADEANKHTILLTGVITANIQVTVPTGVKSWVFRNATTGAFTVTIAQATGTGVVVKQGYAASVMADGTNVAYANATADTATPGDSSKLIANTEFVGTAVTNALGLRSKSITTVTVNQTLSTSSLGGTIVAAHASGLLQLTLPALSGVADGQRFEIFSESASTSGTFIVANTGESIIVNNTMFTNPSGLLLYAGDSLTVERVSSGQWLAVGGTAQLRYSESFKLVSNIGTPLFGYKKEPNGVITQWGFATSSATVGAPITVTLPITFPVLLANIDFACAITYGGTPIGQSAVVWTDGSFTTSQFTAYSDISSMGFFYKVTGR